MVKRRRRMFSAAESTEVWDRWQRGEGLNQTSNRRNGSKAGLTTDVRKRWKADITHFLVTACRAGARPPKC